LHRQLQWVTNESAVVAGDTRRLGRRVAEADVSGARSAAVRLKRDALAFSAKAGACGNRVRQLGLQEHQTVAKRYLGLIAGTLSTQWWEGTALARVADLVWKDPMLTVGNDSAQLAAGMSWAAGTSRQAVNLASRAAVLRHRFPSAFRYLPVKPGQ
ncbi:MAG TPA: hypothetical protein VF221_09520, partial [Chloroflexota bacterium]